MVEEGDVVRNFKLQILNTIKNVTTTPILFLFFFSKKKKENKTRTVQHVNWKPTTSLRGTKEKKKEACLPMCNEQLYLFSAMY